MTKTNAATGVKAEYAQKVADDLAANQSEQDRVRDELARMQDELVQLEESGRVLVEMQGVLGISSKPTGKSVRKTAKVPAARIPKSEAAAKKTPKTGRSSKSAAEPSTRGKTRTTKAATAHRAGGPSWIELIGAYLAGQSEPKSSTEIAAGVAEAHPQRGVQVTVVRNTLEQGVARGVIERSKQGRSVYYQTAPAGAEATDDSKATAV
ncbi:hypothetical protein OG760_35560 [Streptomyces sp. NBC_00963]|uniref:hypothetical protein n=1 Tax=Streptomyces sp. NBC_00963 TaxID=2903697 RepID=UPI00386C9F3A|nr:hypothetical protein OG760_35560 [Streptomyces sp. NBC_00963]